MDTATQQVKEVGTTFFEQMYSSVPEATEATIDLEGYAAGTTTSYIIHVYYIYICLYI